jgi:hypothetical protein
MTPMKTRKPTTRRKTKTKPPYLGKTFTIYRKYRNHQRFVHSELL